MTCESHDYVYVGAFNVFIEEELLKVIEAWRCRVCGTVLAGERQMGPISSTEGMRGPASQESGERWMVVARQGRGSLPPDAILIKASPGSRVRVESIELHDSSLVVKDDLSVVREVDGEPPTTVRVYELLSVLKGYIDLSVWPPKVFTLQAKQQRQL
ncbi:MAG: hypothetical protein NZ988_01745 [Thaumarchaeota archaeon]|nr:hypothetical protein [Candidatus Calditenuaceae archaeon]MDW8186758.1 hypothetical protein [Nitrososphaerota archaeon]